MQLPDLSAVPPLQGHEWKALSCKETAFSSCGNWLAVVLTGIQFDCRPNPPDRWCFVYEVVLYSVAEGFHQHARFSTGSSCPVVRWADAAPRLSVALAPVYTTHEVPSDLPAAVIIDAPAGVVLHSLGP